MDADARARMNDYDRRAWDAIQDWREKQASGRVRRLLPQRARDAAASGARAAKNAPGAAAFLKLVISSLEALVSVAARASAKTIGPKAVFAAHRKRGVVLTHLDDLLLLDLQQVDRAVPDLEPAYVATALAEGAAAGLTVTGGWAGILGGSVTSAGAAAAPGALAMAGTVAADAVAVMVLDTRLVAHVALYYGFDPSEPEERAFALAVLNVGSSPQGLKRMALFDLGRVANLLARKATWEALRHHAITVVAEAFYKRMGQRLIQRKLGQIVPFAGVAIGAGQNAHHTRQVHEAASNLYRERFLQRKYAFSDPIPEKSVVPSSGFGDEAEDDISVADLIEMQLAEDAVTNLDAPDPSVDLAQRTQDAAQDGVDRP